MKQPEQRNDIENICNFLEENLNKKVDYLIFGYDDLVYIIDILADGYRIWQLNEMYGNTILINHSVFSHVEKDVILLINSNFPDLGNTKTDDILYHIYFLKSRNYYYNKELKNSLPQWYIDKYILWLLKQ